MKTSFFAQSFSKVLIIFSLSVTSLFALANNSVIDYQLQSTVYHWYGVLDKPELPIPTSADVDLKEYQNQQRVAGAHHILTITPVSQKNDTQIVEVELEFLPKDMSKTQVIGQYVIQQLTIDTQLQQVTASKTELNEFDDFNSNYRDAGNLNLIKSFVFGWTQTLDKLSEGKPVSTRLVNRFAAKSEFSAEENAAENPAQYIAIIKKQDYLQSRRAIKNLNIRRVKGSNAYTVSYQYVWNATNHDNESELAQVGIELKITIENGEIKIESYQAKYLPPVTDLGAEIRC